MLAATIRASDAQVLAATGRSVAAGETAARAPFEFFPQLEHGPEGPIRSSLGLPVTCRDGSRLGLDLYRVPSAGPRPAVILIYGGAWRFGTRANMRPYALELAALGYTAIAVDYRHAPQHRYPTQVDDVRAALATIARNARAWDVDPGSVALLGESAGAELALLAAYEPGPLHARAVVAYYAPLDLAGGYRDPPRPDPADIRNILRTYLGGSPDRIPRAYAAASPRTYVRAGLPPTLLIGGTRDELVAIAFQHEMASALAAAGDPVASLEFPWSNHGFAALPYGLGGQLGRYYTERFLAETLNLPGAPHAIQKEKAAARSTGAAERTRDERPARRRAPRPPHGGAQHREAGVAEVRNRVNREGGER
jgi:acetyl esterase/lipase